MSREQDRCWWCDEPASSRKALILAPVSEAHYHAACKKIADRQRARGGVKVVKLKKAPPRVGTRAFKRAVKAAEARKAA